MKRVILISSGLLLAGGAVWAYFNKQKELLSKFTWAVAGVKVKSVTAQSVSINVTIRFDSIADIEAEVQSLYLNATINGQSIGYITDIKSFVLPAHNSTLIPLNVEFSPALIAKSGIGIVGAVLNKQTIQLGLDGYAKVKSGIITVKLPIKYP